MSTYAAVFLFDENTEKFNGFTVKYDGYIKNGVGETLFKYWNNHDKVRKLTAYIRTDMRELGTDFDSNDWFSDEHPARYKHFKNLTYDEMLNEGGNVDYLYVMVPDDRVGWDWKVQENDRFSSLSKYFPGE